MYAWGNDTSTWQGPGSYDFGSARARNASLAASVKGARAFNLSSVPNMGLVGTKGKTIESLSKNPLVVAIDVTGSMQTWPAEIFDRLPLVYQTLSKYRDDIEICFAAIGDANSDNYPLQVNSFGKGVDLEAHLKALGAEGNGGGQGMETYELFAYFMLKHANVPNATSPNLIIFGDEGFYETIDPRQVKHYIGDTLEKELASADVWKALQQKFNVHMLHKRYDGHDAQIVDQWARVLGKEKVVELPAAERAVDVALGLIARQWGHYSDFSHNLSARQNSKTAQSVHTSLRHVADPQAAPTNSVVKNQGGGKKSQRLV